MFKSIYGMDDLSTVQHIGYASESRMYDFTLVFSDHFFGKTLVTCLQSGNSSLLDFHDVSDTAIVKKVFRIKDDAIAQEVSALLKTKIPLVKKDDTA
ncbi:SAV0927 family protein [Alkalihalobacterium alkalinitrilicum]|uniref:SAV0927 family protein n=1 Tax=Alkalihalobacterium alkalinitrilicum TaxID=427920 RepID=UPI00099597D2|nr:SAV0927 family protein [Alkalihalobacterium alkalinitrilicum]